MTRRNGAQVYRLFDDGGDRDPGGLLAQGRTAEQIVTDYPQLVVDDVRASLEFAAIAVSERQVPLRTTA